MSINQMSKAAMTKLDRMAVRFPEERPFFTERRFRIWRRFCRIEQPQLPASEMPAYKVIYEDGGSYVTSMAKGITLDQARAYFVGEYFEQHDGSMKQVKEVYPALHPTWHRAFLIRMEWKRMSKVEGAK